MKPHVDHVLCILPFEPDVLERLGGPPGTFVGHRLTQEPGIVAAAAAQARKHAGGPDAPKTLLVLPGSRRREIRTLIEPFGETVDLLAARGHDFRVIVPTVPHVAPMVEAAAAGWAVRPQITVEAEAKWRAFAEADAALAKSGTVSLELALAHVPFVVAYKSDLVLRLMASRLTLWSAILPNIIADRPVVPEFYDLFVRAPTFVRHLEQLWTNSPARTAQLAGFDAVAGALHVDRPSGAIAAQIVLDHANRRRKS